MPSNATLDDRARDRDLDRLRDAVAHVIDVARSVVRAELDAGSHPEDALIRGLTMLESWEAGMRLDASVSAGRYAADIDSVLTPLVERLGADRLWAWLRQPSSALHGRTPLACLVAHKTHQVTQAAEDIAAIPRPFEPHRPDPRPTEPVPLLTGEEYFKLFETGLLPEKMELFEGRVYFGRDPQTEEVYDPVFAPAHARAAAALGIQVYSAVDAVLRDPHAIQEFLLRLSQTVGRPEQPSAPGEQK